MSAEPIKPQQTDQFASIRALMSIGDARQARQWLETRLRMIPQGSPLQIEGRLLLSEIFLLDGDRQAAVETLEEIIAAYPQQMEARARLRGLRRGFASGWSAAPTQPPAGL